MQAPPCFSRSDARCFCTGAAPLAYASASSSPRAPPPAACGAGCADTSLSPCERGGGRAAGEGAGRHRAEQQVGRRRRRVARGGMREACAGWHGMAQVGTSSTYKNACNTLTFTFRRGWHNNKKTVCKSRRLLLGWVMGFEPMIFRSTI